MIEFPSEKENEKLLHHVPDNYLNQQAVEKKSHNLF